MLSCLLHRWVGLLDWQTKQLLLQDPIFPYKPTLLPTYVVEILLLHDFVTYLRWYAY